MQQKTVSIVNMNGIHCRPSSAIVKVALQYKSDLKAEASSGNANVKSMIEIITLALHKGDDVIIIAEGEDEAEALEAVSEAFAAHYDYPDK